MHKGLLNRQWKLYPAIVRRMKIHLILDLLLPLSLGLVQAAQSVHEADWPAAGVRCRATATEGVAAPQLHSCAPFRIHSWSPEHRRVVKRVL
jgi:hypothetical protein